MLKEISICNISCEGSSKYEVSNQASGKISLEMEASRHGFVSRPREMTETVRLGIIAPLLSRKSLSFWF